MANDLFGETIRRELEREGVALRHTFETEKSAISVVMVDEATRSRTILYREKETQAGSIFETDQSLDARLLQISASGRAERAAIRWANRKQMPIMLDADYFDPAYAGRWAGWDRITGDIAPSRGNAVPQIRPLPRPPLPPALPPRLLASPDYRRSLDLLGYEHPAAGRAGPG